MRGFLYCFTDMTIEINEILETIHRGKYTAFKKEIILFRQSWIGQVKKKYWNMMSYIIFFRCFKCLFHFQIIPSWNCSKNWHESRIRASIQCKQTWILLISTNTESLQSNLFCNPKHISNFCFRLFSFSACKQFSYELVSNNTNPLVHIANIFEIIKSDWLSIVSLKF